MLSQIINPTVNVRKNLLKKFQTDFKIFHSENLANELNHAKMKSTIEMFSLSYSE